MNSLFVSLGLADWKPVLTALLLPPVPLLMLILVGARLLPSRRGPGWTLVLAGVVALWLSACSGTADLFTRLVLRPPPALGADRVATMRTAPRGQMAIVVLGGGMEPYAPEYRLANLSGDSLERLRYGIWLGRETGWPVAFSGGVGWAQPDAPAEARVAERIAATEYGRPLKWVEDASRDTRENALRTLALLRPAGIREIVLVTHAMHMPRALRNFERAAGADVRVVPAPIGLARGVDTPALAWMPSSRGLRGVRDGVREWLGRVAGA